MKTELSQFTTTEIINHLSNRIGLSRLERNLLMKVYEDKEKSLNTEKEHTQEEINHAMDHLWGGYFYRRYEHTPRWKDNSYLTYLLLTEIYAIVARHLGIDKLPMETRKKVKKWLRASGYYLKTGRFDGMPGLRWNMPPLLNQ